MYVCYTYYKKIWNIYIVYLFQIFIQKGQKCYLPLRIVMFAFRQIFPWSKNFKSILKSWNCCQTFNWSQYTLYTTSWSRIPRIDINDHKEITHNWCLSCFSSFENQEALKKHIKKKHKQKSRLTGLTL